MSELTTDELSTLLDAMEAWENKDGADTTVAGQSTGLAQQRITELERGAASWVWMPHAGHLMVGQDCRFHLTTKVGAYIVSTVGEYWPDRDIRRIEAEARGLTIPGRGDEWDANYMRLIGYEEIGLNRLYETMVFHAVPRVHDNDCCPWMQRDGTNLDFEGYNTAGDAYRGHLAMCEKYALTATSEPVADDQEAT